MANTTNFGWETPDDTDLVKDGAAAIRTLGSSIDTSFVDLKGGTTGQVLAKATNTDLDFTWVAQDDSNAIQNAIVDAKGDLISATAADTPARLASSGVNGDVLTVDTSTATGLKWATPSSGVTKFTLRNSNTVGDAINTIDYNGSNLYVAAGASGNLYTSSNGITWTQRTSGFGANTINKVVYANNIWVAVGSGGMIATSTDGTTWTARTSNVSTNQIYDIHYAAGYFVIAANGGGATNTGGVAYSTDGITWTRKSMTPSIGTLYLAVTHNGTNWFIGATNSTNNSLYASDPTGTWTAQSVASSNTIWWAGYDGTRTVIATAAEVILYSTSSTFASFTAYNLVGAAAAGAPSGRYRNYLYNGTIYQTNGLYWQSFSTTQTNQVPNTIADAALAPGIQLSQNGTIGSNANSIFAGSAGVIIGGNFCSIFTSF